MPIQHTVLQGETLVSIAERHGHFAKTVWDDPANAALKQKRSDMCALLPGDRVNVPDLRPKSVGKAVEKHHRFRRKGIPAVLRIQLFDDRGPRREQEWTLTVDGVRQSGTTDGQGIVEAFVPASARRGQLVIGPDRLVLDIALGHMDPFEEISGVQKRLSNLGFFHGDCDGAPGEELSSALAAFQRFAGLPVTGELDATTKTKLRDAHDQPAAEWKPKT